MIGLIFKSFVKSLLLCVKSVDFLIKFKPDVSFRDYDSIENGFSALLGRGVDIVSSSVLPSAPRFANRVCREAVSI